jgi:uncharacterized membrane protein
VATNDGALDKALAVTATGQHLGAEGHTADSPENVAPPADPIGFSLAGLTLFGMVGAVVYVARLFGRPPTRLNGRAPAALHLSWAIPILALLGLGVASYLSYVELTQVEAICGPVGECNIVQHSPYARLLGIPVAVLGALSYIAIAVLWVGQRVLEPRLSALSLTGLMVLTIFGTLFSIYLTLLELFAIKAICAWCLSSAVLTTLQMIIVVTQSTPVHSANKDT